MTRAKRIEKPALEKCLPLDYKKEGQNGAWFTLKYMRQRQWIYPISVGTQLIASIQTYYNRQKENFQVGTTRERGIKSEPHSKLLCRCREGSVAKKTLNNNSPLLSNWLHNMVIQIRLPSRATFVIMVSTEVRNRGRPRYLKVIKMWPRARTTCNWPSSEPNWKSSPSGKSASRL